MRMFAQCCGSVRLEAMAAQSSGMARMTAMVRFDGVGLRYGRAGQGTHAEAGPEVLHDLSFVLPDGAFRWLLGPSGAGKTSLLRLMYLAIRPTRGRLAIFGTDIETAERRAAAAAAAAHRRGVPGFPPAAASVGVRQRRTAAAHRRPAGGPDPRRCRRDAALGGPGEAGRRAAGGTVGRRAAAGGDRARGDQPPQPAAGRRADRQPRRGAGRAADAVVQGDEPAGHHGRGRHPQRRAGRPASGAARCGCRMAGWWRSARRWPRSARAERCGPLGFDELGLRRAISDRMLPFLVAAMAFLAALALAGWVGAASLARHWQQGAGSALTVQVPRAAGAGGAGRRRAAGSGVGAAGGHARHRLGAPAQRRGTRRVAAPLARQRRRTACRAVARGDRGAAGRCRRGTRPAGAPAGRSGAGHAGREPRRVDPPPFRARAQPAGLRGTGACCWWRRSPRR